MFCISDAKHEAQFFKVEDQAGHSLIKMLLFTNQSQETITYNVKMEDIFSLSQ